MNRQHALLFDMHFRPVALRRGATRLGGSALGLVAGIMLLGTLAALLYLSQASTAAGLRHALVQRERDIMEVREGLVALRCEIATIRSSTLLEQRATQLGLVDAAPSDSFLACYVPPAQAAYPGLSLAARTAEPHEQPAALQRLLVGLGHSIGAGVVHADSERP